MEPSGVTLVPVKSMRSYRPVFWTIFLSFFLTILCQIAVPMVMYNQIHSMNEHISSIASDFNLRGNKTIPVYVVSLHQVMENAIELLKCWAGGFLFLMAVMMYSCMKFKSLVMALHNSSDNFGQPIKLMKKKANDEDIKKREAEKPPKI